METPFALIVAAMIIAAAFSPVGPTSDHSQHIAQSTPAAHTGTSTN